MVAVTFMGLGSHQSPQVNFGGTSRRLAAVPYYGPPLPVTTTPKPNVPYYGPPLPVTTTPKPQTPVTTTPKPEPPVTTTPKPETPVTTTPKPQTPGTTTPKPQTPVTTTPKPETPVTTTPKPETPVTTTPKPETPVTTTPKPESPVTTTPQPDIPVTTTPAPVVNTTTAPPEPTPTTPVPTTGIPPTEKDTSAEARTVTTMPPPVETTTAPPESATGTPAPTTAAPTVTAEPPAATTVSPTPATVSPVTLSPMTNAPTVAPSTTKPTATTTTTTMTPIPTPSLAPIIVATEAPPAPLPSTTPLPVGKAPSASGKITSANNGAVSGSTTSDENTVVFMVGGAAVCIGVVLVVALLILYRRRQSRPSTPSGEADDYTVGYRTARGTFRGVNLGADEPQSLAVCPLPQDFRKDPILQSVRLPLDEIELGAFLSRGAFGEVLKATYKKETVVIKRLLRERRLDMTEARLFAQEIQLMATLRHPRIVHLVGAAWDAPATLCAVTEFMDGGDVRSLLTTRQALGLPIGFDEPKVRIALHVAEALAYLHGRNQQIIHRDLKSKNVVLSKEGDAKLTDFGVSRARCELTMTSAVGSSLWMAPEVIAGGRYDEKADIFSFGVLLSELDTHLLPYRYGPNANRNLSEVALLHQVQSGALTVAFSGRDYDMMTITARSCVALNPRERPTAAELRMRLEATLGL